MTFAPNKILQVTPQFLDTAITQSRALGFDTVSMDEALVRIRSDKPQKPFVVFTFDDAYRDNLEFALPVLRARGCPFTLYVPTALVDGVGEVWWQALEDIIARRESLSVETNGEIDTYTCKSNRQKSAVYAKLYARMRSMPEDERVSLIHGLAQGAGFDLAEHCRSLIMDWPELQTFVDEPLCTIGAHTVHHYELAKLSAKRVKSEIEQSVRTLQIQFGSDPQHFSYPIGSAAAAGQREYDLARQAGLKSAVTTIPGGLYAHHRHTPHALPRISLNGRFQEPRFMPLFLAGGLFSLPGRFNRSFAMPVESPTRRSGRGSD